jgi:transposase
MTPSRTFPSGDIFRARLILLLADGLPYRSIEERLDTTAPTIARWKKHFLEDRVAGQLESRHPGQKPLRVHARTASQGLSATQLTGPVENWLNIWVSPRTRSNMGPD